MNEYANNNSSNNANHIICIPYMCTNSLLVYVYQ